jgi:hypothetical protein
MFRYRRQIDIRCVPVVFWGFWPLFLQTSSSCIQSARSTHNISRDDKRRAASPTGSMIVDLVEPEPTTGQVFGALKELVHFQDVLIWRRGAARDWTSTEVGGARL